MVRAVFAGWPGSTEVPRAQGRRPSQRRQCFYAGGQDVDRPSVLFQFAAHQKAGAERATFLYRSQTGTGQMTLTRPVSSSRLMKTTPLDVIGMLSVRDQAADSDRFPIGEVCQAGGRHHAQSIEVLSEKFGRVAVWGEAGCPQVGSVYFDGVHVR